MTRPSSTTVLRLALFYGAAGPLVGMLVILIPMGLAAGPVAYFVLPFAIVAAYMMGGPPAAATGAAVAVLPRGAAFQVPAALVTGAVFTGLWTPVLHFLWDLGAHTRDTGGWAAMAVVGGLSGGVCAACVAAARAGRAQEKSPAPVGSGADPGQ